MLVIYREMRKRRTNLVVRSGVVLVVGISWRVKIDLEIRRVGRWLLADGRLSRRRTLDNKSKRCYTITAFAAHVGQHVICQWWTDGESTNFGFVNE